MRRRCERKLYLYCAIVVIGALLVLLAPGYWWIWGFVFGFVGITGAIIMDSILESIDRDIEELLTNSKEDGESI
jgi:hypothetical protein